MHSIIKLFSAMTKVERITFALLSIILVLSFGMLLRKFYIENTMNTAEQGGTYIEGSVGELKPLNPWFVTGNDVSRDVLALVFAGLMKYDPDTQTIVDDLAKVTISDDNRVYTAELKTPLFWHDSTEKSPHPVTADDVMFTFKTIQENGFANPILQQNFRGIEITKINDRTVRFKLSKPYSFFTSNLTLGLVPKASFEGVPVDKLQDTLDFGFHPIGAGPYRFSGLVQTEMSTEITLQRWTRPAMPAYNIERVILRIFNDYTTLLTDILNMNAVRLAARSDEGEPILPKRFHPITYTLPQYVGLFFNLDRPIPSDRNVRLGLQLGTNKQAIVDSIHEVHVIDTPLLEINLGDWQYTFDATAGQGAFFESNWNMPEKIRLQRLLEQREANETGPLKSAPRIAYLSTGAILTITGSTKDVTFPLTINNVKASTGSLARTETMSGAWIVQLTAGSGMSGSLKLGLNTLRMMDGKGDIVDTAFVERIGDATIYRRASDEQQLVTRFIASKKMAQNDPRRITVQDLYLDFGYLRLKSPTDQPHTRVNDKGTPLRLTLLTSNTPATYRAVASAVAEQWRALGVQVNIDIPETKKEFEDKLLRRNYDVILFGESLFDNLDSYPYWHSSQIQERDNPKNLKLDAFNLSQYASFDADADLAKVRETNSGKSRTQALKALNEQWKKDVPAIILYSPLAVYAHDDTIHGITLKKLSLHADRFAHFSDWYVTTKRKFIEGRGWLSFPGWLLQLL